MLKEGRPKVKGADAGPIPLQGVADAKSEKEQRGAMQEIWADGTVLLEIEDGLWTVRLNRPDKANALTEDMLEALLRIAEAAGSARGIVLTGCGGVFSAGADLEAARAGLATSDLWERLSGTIAELPGLTIAALNGTVAGGAMGMVLACDLRVAVPRTRMFYPVMKLGFLPQPSDPRRMRQLIGPARTKLILMGGQRIEAEEAYGFGLIDRVVPEADLDRAVRSVLTDTLAAPEAVAFGIKQLCGD